MLYNAALVLEGGAMRGQYTAGVLDLFMQHHIQFKTVIGVSAGALCATNYIANQPGRTNLVNTRYRDDRDYISLRRALHRQDIINLDYLFEPHGGDWQDFDEYAYRTSPMAFIPVATGLATGQAQYFHHPQGKDLRADLKASSAMPFVSNPVFTGLGLCLDGGVADSIPYAYARACGFDKIVVVRTRPRGYRKTSTSAVLRQAYQRAFSDYPAFAKTAIARPDMYNRQADELLQLEHTGHAFVIAPRQPVTVGRLEHDVSKLATLHATGLADANVQLSAMTTYLAG